MSLLTPDSGLLFWMVLSFGIVLVVLSKYGFPIIIKSIEQRKAYIDNSLETARKANEQLAHIKEEGEKILLEAREQQQAILKEAFAKKEEIINEARLKAQSEALLQIKNATRRIEEEKQKAILKYRDIKFNPYRVKGNVLGSEKADVVIELYSDYVCPLCYIHNIMLHQAVKDFSEVSSCGLTLIILAQFSKSLLYITRVTGEPSVFPKRTPDVISTVSDSIFILPPLP